MGSISYWAIFNPYPDQSTALFVFLDFGFLMCQLCLALALVQFFRQSLWISQRAFQVSIVVGAFLVVVVTSLSIAASSTRTNTSLFLAFLGAQVAATSIWLLSFVMLMILLAYRVSQSQLSIEDKKGTLLKLSLITVAAGAFALTLDILNLILAVAPAVLLGGVIPPISSGVKVAITFVFLKIVPAILTLVMIRQDEKSKTNTAQQVPLSGRSQSVRGSESTAEVDVMNVDL